MSASRQSRLFRADQLPRVAPRHGLSSSTPTRKSLHWYRRFPPPQRAMPAHIASLPSPAREPHATAARTVNIDVTRPAGSTNVTTGAYLVTGSTPQHAASLGQAVAKLMQDGSVAQTPLHLPPLPQATLSAGAAQRSARASPCFWCGLSEQLETWSPRCGRSSRCPCRCTSSSRKLLPRQRRGCAHSPFAPLTRLARVGAAGAVRTASPHPADPPPWRPTDPTRDAAEVDHGRRSL